MTIVSSWEDRPSKQWPITLGNFDETRSVLIYNPTMPNPRAISRLDSFDLLDFDSDYIPAVAGSAQLSILWLSHSSPDTPAPEGEQDRNEDSTAATVSELPIVPLSETRRGRQAHAENDSSNPTENGSERTAKENINSQQKVASPQEEAASADGPEHPV